MVAEPRRYRASTDRPATLDLSVRWVDVRRIAKSHPAYRWCMERGWDSEELMSEVMVRVLARQGMASRYDPAKAGVSKYLWVCTGSIMRNLAVSVRYLGSSEEGLDDEGSVDEAPDPDGLEWVDTIEW